MKPSNHSDRFAAVYAGPPIDDRPMGFIYAAPRVNPSTVAIPLTSDSNDGMQPNPAPYPQNYVVPKFCPSCGSPNKPDYKFCPNCGYKLPITNKGTV